VSVGAGHSHSFFGALLINLSKTVNSGDVGQVSYGIAEPAPA